MHEKARSSLLRRGEFFRKFFRAELLDCFRLLDRFCLLGRSCLLDHFRLLDCFRGEPRLSHVILTDSCMLEPEKSMLYVFGADPSFPERSVEHDCSQCPNTTCFFRMEGEASYYCND